MSNIVPFNTSKVAAVFGSRTGFTFGDVTQGITEGFATMRYKGKVWKVKKGGTETLIADKDGEPAPSIEVIIVNAASAISKHYYENKFSEGADVGAPTCWSVNGVTPDAASAKKQHTSCVSCPKNIYGSHVSDAGVASKACSDRRRLAIVPTAAILQGKDGQFGGPILLSIPPTSLKALAQYQKDCQALGGFPYYAVSTRISFDSDSAHPKLKFKAVRPLDEAEAEKVIEMAMDELTSRMLNTAVEGDVKHEDTAKSEPDGFFEKPLAAAAPVLEEAPFEAEKPKVTRVKKEAAPAQETKPTPASSDLDAALNGLFG